MHKYMRAIGFSEYSDRKKLKELLTETVVKSDRHDCSQNKDNILLGEFCKDFADNMGIAVCGEFVDNNFTYEYFYPYLVGSGITSIEDVSVERHAGKDSYAGVCDDMRVGISLIFYLHNMITYVRALTEEKLPVRGTTLTLSGLSINGSILMAIEKDEKQKNRVKRRTNARNKLIEAAKQGNEEAIETLTMEDIDTYSVITSRLQKEDVFSIVDSYFMPYGVECDQYSIMGEIVGMKKTQNHVTGEEIYILTILCNELTFDVCINIIDLFGEPQVGRRFKGVIWLQGVINYPKEA